LFANLEEITEHKEKEKTGDYYNEMLENRVRPAVPGQPELKPEQNETKKMEELIIEEKTGIQEPASMEPVSYTHEEILEKATEYFGGDTLAANVWMNKYALKDSDGNIYELTPDDMHRRLASEVARIEKRYPNPLSEDEIFDLFRNFRYIIPQGSPMAGIGNNFQVSSLSNCFVIGGDGNYDSYGGIMKIDQEQVQLMKRRGGVGHDLSHIRPTGSPVKNSALTSTGIVPFMERYSNSTREVAQDGRRGALMLTISVKHPDAERFIDAKLEQGKVTGANVSVKIDDDFMRSVVDGTSYRQQYPIMSVASSIRLCREIPLKYRISMPGRYGIKSFTMHGNRLNPVFFSGIRLFVNRCPTAMPISALKRFQPIRAEKYPSVPTTAAG